VANLPRIALIEDLLSGPVPPGSNFLVEFDPSSQWYNAVLTIAAGWLNTRGKVTYILSSRAPDDIRAQLTRLGIDVPGAEASDTLRIWDAYSKTLGLQSHEKYRIESLNVADLRIWASKEFMHQPPSPDLMYVTENSSIAARYNDEKSWIEYTLTRIYPAVSMTKATNIRGITLGVHSESAYKQLEAAADGVIDLKVEELEGELHNLIRIRKMLNAKFDARWHKLKVNDNFETTLEK
jgi:KaiC/GvpD/RAD55 family RecA-like ATPase